MGEQGDEQDVGRGGRHQPFCGAESPEVLSIADGVGYGLAAVDDGDDAECSQGGDGEMHSVLAIGQRGGTEEKEAGAEDPAGEGDLSDAPGVGVRGLGHPVRGIGHGEEVAGDHDDDHEERGEHGAAGHEETDGEKKKLRDFLRYGAEDVAEDSLKGTSAFFDGSDDADEAGLGEDNAGGGPGDVGCGGNRDADLCLAQCGSIVRAVAAHADGVAGGLEGLHEMELAFGQDAGIDGEVGGFDGAGDRAWGADGAGQPDLARDDGGGSGSITGDHDGGDAEGMEFSDERGGVRPRGIAEGDETDACQRLTGTGCNGQDTVSLGLKVLCDLPCAGGLQ